MQRDGIETEIKAEEPLIFYIVIFMLGRSIGCEESISKECLQSILHIASVRYSRRSLGCGRVRRTGEEVRLFVSIFLRPKRRIQTNDVAL